MNNIKLKAVSATIGCEGCCFGEGAGIDCEDLNKLCGVSCFDDKLIFILVAEPAIEVTTIPEEVVRGEADFEYFGGYIGL